MEKGVVKHFNTIKKFGFIRTEVGEEIFFHLSDGRPMTYLDGPIFLDQGKLPSSPRQGDLVYFLRSEGRKSVKSSPWGFEFQVRQAVREIGLSLLKGYEGIVERIPCLLDIVLTEKKAGDNSSFTLSVIPQEQSPLGGYGVEEYNGSKRMYYLVTWNKESGWKFYLLDYRRLVSSGNALIWWYPPIISVQIDNYELPSSTKKAIVGVNIGNNIHHVEVFFF